MLAEVIETDVLVIGGGAAGCSAALKAHALGAKVLMVVKGKMGRSGATPLASGIHAPPRIKGPLSAMSALKGLFSLASNAVRFPIPASYEAGLRLMVQNHYGLADQDYFLDFGFWALKHFYPGLESTGLYFRRNDDGSPAFPAAGADTLIAHSHGMTGYLFGESKRKQVLAAGIHALEEATVFSLLDGDDGEVTGAMVLDYRTGRLYAVKAGTTIIATGHTNWLSRRSTGTREMAANGLAMAARAGAELHNLEIQWFHASDMASPESWMRLHHYPNPLTASTHRVKMVNNKNEMYMATEEYSTMMPYTIQMKKLYEQVKLGKADWSGGSFADFSGVERDALREYQYNWEFYDHLGKDMGRDKLECGMTWHMTAGGIKANIRTMATAVRRLYIAGAVGGHMLGSLPFATFDGDIAGASAVRFVRKMGRGRVRSEQIAAAEKKLQALVDGAGSQPGGISPIQMKRNIREVTWHNMMFARTEASLNAALAELAHIRNVDLPKMRLRQKSLRYNIDLVDALDIEDMLDVLEMAAHASLLRRESRGPHFREDFQVTDNVNWLKQIVISRRGGEIELRTEPVKQKYIPYKRERIEYFKDPYC